MMAFSGTVRQCVLAACFLLAFASTSAGQEERALTISVNRSTVSPGDTLQLTVGSPSGVRFEMIAVIVETIGIADFVTTLPATIPVQIPRNLRPGRYAISAVGRTTASQQVKVGTRVAVERGGLPASLSASLPEIEFFWLGDEHSVRLLADFPDGEEDVTGSTRVTYTSSDPRVASVDETGRVRAVSAGPASVIARYTEGDAHRELVIPVIVPPPPFRISPTPLAFGEVAVESVASRTITITNTTDGPLAISSVATGYEEVFRTTSTCRPDSPLPITASCTITVTFKPPRALPEWTIVWLETADERIGVTVAGTGVARD